MAEDLTTAELDLRGYLRVFQRRRGVVAASVIVMVMAGLGLFFVKTPVYTAEARVILRGRIAETAVPVVIVGRDPARAVQTEIEVFKSQSVRDAVRREMGSVPVVTVRPVGQTDVLAISSTDPSASQAAKAANAFASAYVDLRQGQADDDFNSAAAEVQPQIAALQVEIDAIGARVASTSSDNRESVRSALAPQRDAYVARQAQLTQGLIQLR
ncbi:MAG: Wzz/FepE/Etk N-terminal domain-containing protein, partial [Pseudonocardiaceae bacterium]